VFTPLVRLENHRINGRRAGVFCRRCDFTVVGRGMADSSGALSDFRASDGRMTPFVSVPEGMGADPHRGGLGLNCFPRGAQGWRIPGFVAHGSAISLAGQ